jgi:glycosyltransferase involved in cell wall biosynthesis
MLARLLDSLAVQKTPSTWRFEIVVVDNDRSRSAHDAVTHAQNKYRNLEINYAVEPRQGIAYARNLAVALARGSLMAFIDDDEYATPDWLNTLACTLIETKADAVLGPVVPHFPQNSKRWVMRSGIFERPSIESGTSLRSSECRTGNALIAGAWLRCHRPEPFDVRLSRSGGEDTDFFDRISRAGAKFVWSAAAIVFEEVPINRQSLAYIILRKFRASAVFWQLRAEGLPRIKRIGLVVVGITAGIAFLVTGLITLPFRFEVGVKLLAKCASGLGRIGLLHDFDIVTYGQSDG